MAEFENELLKSSHLPTSTISPPGISQMPPPLFLSSPGAVSNVDPGILHNPPPAPITGDVNCS